MSKPNIYRAWAIDTGDGRFIGRYWCNRPDASMEGHVIAAWMTRKEAKDALVRVRRSFSRAMVRRVTVTITVDGGTP